jgi:hypothetical protein
VSVTTATETQTESESRFNKLVPSFQGIGVTVAHVRHMPGTGELHVTLCLPNHDRAMREKVLGMVQDFESAYAHTVTVSPAFTYEDDDTD